MLSTGTHILNAYVIPRSRYPRRRTAALQVCVYVERYLRTFGPKRKEATQYFVFYSLKQFDGIYVLCFQILPGIKRPSSHKVYAIHPRCL